MAISDRDLIIGLFEAVGALARRITGDTLVVTITDSATGERFPMYSPSSDARWINGVCTDVHSEDREDPPIRPRSARHRAPTPRPNAPVASSEEPHRRHRATANL